MVTSPPYWGLRDYSLDEGIGLEATLAEHLDNLVVRVPRAAPGAAGRRGMVWLNYGDAYAGGGRGQDDNREDKGQQGTNAGSMGLMREAGSGLAPKQLMGLPWRVAFALQDDGWWLRSAIVWHKPNPMPESVRDRPTNAYEMVFLLAKRSTDYYYADAIWTAAIRQPLIDDGTDKRYRPAGRRALPTSQPNAMQNGLRVRKTDKQRGHVSAFMTGLAMTAGTPCRSQNSRPSGANARNVWTIPTQGRPDAHFATFPDELPRRCILAGTSASAGCAPSAARPGSGLWILDMR